LELALARDPEKKSLLIARDREWARLRRLRMEEIKASNKRKAAAANRRERAPKKARGAGPEPANGIVPLPEPSEDHDEEPPSQDADAEEVAAPPHQPAGRPDLRCAEERETDARAFIRSHMFLRAYHIIDSETVFVKKRLDQLKDTVRKRLFGSTDVVLPAVYEHYIGLRPAHRFAENVLVPYYTARRPYFVLEADKRAFGNEDAVKDLLKASFTSLDALTYGTQGRRFKNPISARYSLAYE
jgi:hypothetical protein